MKTALLKQEKKLHLTLIKNKPDNTKSADTQLCVNTLYPNFTYQNAKGEIVSPENHVQL